MLIDSTNSSNCLFKMIPVDEYRLSEKRKRTGDMFQSLKLGPMLSSGELMRFFFYHTNCYIYCIYNK